MRAETLSRTRIFRTDPALDAAVTAGAELQGVPVSAFLRDTLRAALTNRSREVSISLLPGASGVAVARAGGPC